MNVSKKETSKIKYFYVCQFIHIFFLMFRENTAHLEPCQLLISKQYKIMLELNSIPWESTEACPRKFSIRLLLALSIICNCEEKDNGNCQ